MVFNVLLMDMDSKKMLLNMSILELKKLLKSQQQKLKKKKLKQSKNPQRNRVNIKRLCPKFM